MVYYLYNDEDKQLIGIDKTTCSALSMNFFEGQINDITFWWLLLGRLPEKDLPKNERTLKGFAWRRDEYPSSVSDLFDEDDFKNKVNF